jgi:anti-sigma B factor antagonist
LTQAVLTANERLEITVDHGEQGLLVCLHGRINIDSSPDLRDQLLALLHGQSREPIIVDLSGVSFIDAAGIATLLEGLKIARNRQTKFCLRGLQGRVVHLFEVTGVLTLFDANGCRTAPSGSKVF